MDEDDYDVNYIFHLINKDGDVLDETSLVENNPKFAMYLFMDEFGWKDKNVEGAYVELIEFDDPALYDEPTNFERSENAREDRRTACFADPRDEKDLAELKKCPMYERDVDAPSRLHYCKWCWAIGFRSVCERKPKEVE